jgi:hypothetical protein
VRVQLVQSGDDDFSYERPAVTNLKLAFLIFFTFGLIVGIYALRYISIKVVTKLRKRKVPNPILIRLVAPSFLESLLLM